MAGKRPMGPVFRGNDDDEGDDMGTTETDAIMRRWHYLRDGAELGGNLTALARHGTMDELGAALATMTRDQLEAAAFAMVLVHAEGVSISDE